MKTSCKKIIRFRILPVGLFLIYSMTLGAQTGLSVYTDIGRNNIAKGNIIKSAVFGYFNSGKINIETGFQTDLKNSNKYGFSGYSINVSRNVVVKDILFEIRGFSTWTSPTEILLETNRGALLKMKRNRFEMAVGTNFRTFNLRQEAVKDYEIESKNTQIHEVYNLMYSFSYFLKPKDDKWNVGLTITNIDHFVISQETNPVFNLNGIYKITPPVSLFAEAWYKCAGLTNLELNHFGFFFRTGIIWNIN
jgi:hypothetical protein